MVYQLTKTDDPRWLRTVRGGGGCLYRMHDKSDTIQIRNYNTRALKKMFSGLQAGHVYMHSCDNPPCVDPMHVFGGTHKENAQDCVSKGRHGSHKRRPRPQRSTLIEACIYPVAQWAPNQFAELTENRNENDT